MLSKKRKAIVVYIPLQRKSDCILYSFIYQMERLPYDNINTTLVLIWDKLLNLTNFLKDTTRSQITEKTIPKLMAGIPFPQPQVFLVYRRETCWGRRRENIGLKALEFIKYEAVNKIFSPFGLTIDLWSDYIIDLDILETVVRGWKRSLLGISSLKVWGAFSLWFRLLVWGDFKDLE